MKIDGMLRWGFLTVILVTLLALGFNVSPVAAQAVKDEWGIITIPKGGTIKIGFGAALSGDYAKLGIDIKNGAQLAVEEKKTIQGFKIALEVGDDQCEGAPSVALAEKLGANPSVVGVVGYMCSGGSIPASDVQNKYKKVMISPSSTAIALTAKGLPVVFRVCPNDGAQGTVAGKFVLEKLKKKNVAIIHDKSAYGQGIADIVKATVEKGGGKVLSYEGITRGDKDFSPVLTKIKPLKPELIYFGGMAAEGALIARQMKDVGIDAIFMSDEGLHDVKDFIGAAGKASEGAYITAPRVEEKAKAVVTFKEKYEKKFGPLGVFSRQGYDATVVLMRAVEKVAKKQPDGSLAVGQKALADAVRATKLEGATGKIAFDAKGDNTGAEWKVTTVKGGKFEDVKK
ncbi:MAG: branched-chain amino acid ABC transporter substrate-binding protein [candidate division NC10 bacterium]|nr:branched-chain amino acid ABC transporter substrate-binding protein [candidate division NC10 bacterium]